jgi:cell wall assembly regulator SMI1
MPTDYTKIARRISINELGTGATAQEVAEAARSLGVKWPKSFNQFLREVGWFESGDLTVYGLGPKTPKHLKLVSMAKSERSAWDKIEPMPKGLIPIAPDGRGGHYCLDTNHQVDGECPVLYWDHELVSTGYKPERAAKSFENFFKRNAPKLERPPPKVITLEKGIASLVRSAKFAGLVNGEYWKRGASVAAIRSAEQSLGLRFPPALCELFRHVDGFAHAGAWEHFGVAKSLPFELTVESHYRRLVKKSPKNRRFVPVSTTYEHQLCCVDVDSSPACVVAFRESSLTRIADLGPLAFELWAWRIGKGWFDPWSEKR